MKDGSLLEILEKLIRMDFLKSLKRCKNKYILVLETESNHILFRKTLKTNAPDDIFESANDHFLESINIENDDHGFRMTHSTFRKSSSERHRPRTENLHQTVIIKSVFEKVRGARRKRPKTARQTCKIHVFPDSATSENDELFQITRNW